MCGVENCQTQRSRGQNDGCPRLGVRVDGNEELLLNGYKVCFAICIRSRDLLYNIVPIDNNTILYTVIYLKMIDLMCSYKNSAWKYFGADEYIQYLGCGDGITGICI